MKVLFSLFVLMFSYSSFAQALEDQLYEAISYADYKGAKKAIDRGADVNSLYPTDSAPHTRMIHSAINKGQTKIALEIINHPDFDQELTKPISNRAPLMTAVMNQNVMIVKALIEHGANMNHGATFRAPIQIATAANGNIEILKILLDVNGIDVNAGGRQCALRKAVKFKRLDLVEILLNHPKNFEFSRRCIKGALSNANYHQAQNPTNTKIEKIYELINNM